MSLEIPNGFRIRERFTGVKNTLGQKAGIEQNWGYYVEDMEGNTYLLLYCNPGVFTIIDHDRFDTIRNVNGKQASWYKMKTGYIACHTEINGKKTCITLHQYLTDYHGHGKGQDSIDHINRNKLDNRLSNLRIASQSEQNANRDKVSRKHNAKPLPEGIQQSDLPKFVIYYKEKHGNGMREFFTVEKHPLQILKENGVKDVRTEQLVNKRWATSKAGAKTIQEKLQQAREYVMWLNQL